MSMTKLHLTFEISLFDGGLEAPYEDESNWDLWFYDNFVKSCLNSDALRKNEYIRVLKCVEISEEEPA